MNFRWLLLLALSIGGCASRPIGDVAAGGYQPFALHWQKTYLQPAPITRNYFPEPNVSLNTPAFEQTGGPANGFTTHDQMLAYIADLRARSDKLHVITIGRSLHEKPVPMLVFADAPDGRATTLQRIGRPTVWIHAQQHGDEPAAGEGALAMASELVGSFAWVLEKINVIIVPRVNPDGAESMSRHSANKFDPNRDAMRMMLRETRALRQTNLSYAPVVTVDSHEYNPRRKYLAHFGEGGFLEAHDMLVLGGLNPNIRPPLRKLTDDLLIPAVMTALSEHQLSVTRYHLVRSPKSDEKLRVVSGGTVARIGRNYHGLINQASVLIESRGIGLGRTSFKRRVYSQLLAMRTIVRTVHDNVTQVVRDVALARQQVIDSGERLNDDDPLIIRAAATTHRDVLPYIDVAEQRRKLIPVQYSTYQRARPTLIRRRPFAYLIRPRQRLVVDTLRDIGVKVERLATSRFVEVEAFTVLDSIAEGRVYEGANRRRVTTSQSTHLVHLPAGSYIVYMNQPYANLAAIALEPEGLDSFVAFGLLPSRKNRELPVYRYMQGRRL